MKRLVICAALLSMSVTTALAAKSIRVYTQKVDAKKLCGTEFGRYACSTTKRHMNLRYADIALERIGANPNHFQVLGKIYTGLSGNSVSLSICGNGDTNPFGAADTAAATVPSTFTYKKRSDKKVSAELAADVKNALTAAGVPADKLENLEASFKTTYEQTAGRDNVMQGSYYRLQMKDSVLQALKNPDTNNAKAKACGNRIRGNPTASFIYSIAVIKLDKATYSSNVATDTAISFAAKVKQKAPNADIAALKASVTNAVRTSLQVQLGTEYRVISWDFLKAENLVI